MGFLGIHPDCTANFEDFYGHVAHRLMYVPRIFGDRNRLIVGQSVVLNDVLINTSSGKVVINDFAFLGHNVSLLTGTHDYHQTELARQTAIPDDGRDIVIGQGAWLASNVTVIGPCNIGEHSVIAAGAVVTKDVPSYSVYGGIPARLIDTIERVDI